MATKFQLAILPACMLSLGLTACGGGGGGGNPTDDPDSPTLTIVNASVLEGDSGTSSLQFTVSSDTEASEDLPISYSTADGTASANSDYTAVSDGSVVIPAGATSGTLSIDVTGDTEIEADETFELNFTAPDGTTYQATATITNDDLPKLSIADATVGEGDDGSAQLSFTISLDEANPVEDVSVEVSTADGTATAGSDYTALSAQTVTIPAGETSVEVVVEISGDSEFEPDETFTISLANASNAEIDAGSATGTISNDDPFVADLSVADASVVEGNSGTQVLVFTVRLSEAVTGDVSFEVDTADDTATAGSDYSAVSHTVTIPAGETEATVEVPVAGDTTVENNETLSLTLSNVTGYAVLGDAGATGTIENDDFAVISVSDGNASEGDGSMQFTVNLDQASTADVSVDVSTANGTATAGSDYTALAAQTVTVAAGQTSATFSVSLSEDDDVEADETFTVSLSNPQNAVLGDAEGSGIIVDNDIPRLSISDAQIIEGDVGVQNLVFTIGLSPVSVEDVSVDVSTANGTASAGSDYTALIAQQVTVPAGQGSATVSVPISGDTTVESDEIFVVALSGVSGDALIDGTAASALGTILNDDAVDVSADPANVDEGDSGTATLSFTVKLSAAADLPTAINYSLVPGTATTGTGTAEDDYVDASGTLVIPAGQTSGTIDVTVNADPVVEEAETLSLALTAQDPSRANVTTPSVTGTINNDDRPVVSIDDSSVPEGSSGQTTQLVFTVSLDQTLDEDISVDFASADATAGEAAEQGSDYTANSGQLLIPAGQSSATISVDVSGDDDVETDEIMTMTISNASMNAEIGSGQGSATGTIENDDKPSVTITDTSAFEGDIGDGNSMDFEVTLTEAANGIVDIDYKTTAGTASDGVDYSGTAMSTLSIPAGETGGTISIPIIGDLDVEADEAFSIQLTGSSANVEITTPGAVGTILDDDVTTLNDTGVTSCADADENNLSCPDADVPMQDGDTGRDATLNDDSDGLAGFKFTKLDASGAELDASATDWTCVRDDVTGLIWEIKTADGGDRDQGNVYSWYDSGLDEIVEPTAGLDDGDPATIDNTEAYVDAVNASALCGYDDWRLPTVSELFSITDLGSVTSPALDPAYFPNTAAGLHWTGVSYRDTANLTGRVWGIDFADGHLTPTDKTSLQSIRLVRDEE